MKGYTKHSVYIMEYYSAIKRDGALISATRWMNLKGTMLSERSQTQKPCIIRSVRFHLREMSQKGKPVEIPTEKEKQMSGFQGLTVEKGGALISHLTLPLSVLISFRPVTQDSCDTCPPRRGTPTTPGTPLPPPLILSIMVTRTCESFPHKPGNVEVQALGPLQYRPASTRTLKNE